MTATANKSKKSRLAFTLLELTVVMTVLGVMALAAASMLGSSQTVDALRARQEASVLSSALRTARSTAIASSGNVRVEALRDGRRVVGFRTVAVALPTQPLQPDHRFPEALEVQWSHPAIVFQPTGMSDVSMQISISDQRHRWILDVVSASGQVHTTRTTR